MEAKQALEGLKVVDFSWQYTGPIVTRFLASYGAEVIKIETLERPDGGRGYSPYKDDKPGMNRSTVFANYNTDKYGITINLRKQKAVEIAKRLVARADVVIESYRPGVMKRLRIDYEALKEVKPDIIYLSMSMQGQTGPLSQQITVGMFFQGAIGVTHFTGWPDRNAVGTPLAYPNFIAPWYILVAILAALDYRRRTGKGLYIDFSQLESGVQFFVPALLDWIVNGRLETRMGNRSMRAVPHGAYRCKGEDRWCVIAVFMDPQWEAFREVVGDLQWSKDPKFNTLLGRLQNQDELEKRIEEWTMNHSAEEVMVKMQAAGVPAGVVQNGRDVIERDPQLKHRDHFRELTHPEMGIHICEMPPPRLSKTPAKLSMPAPCLGEHNEYVCCQVVGMSEDEFINLLAEAVIE